MSKIISRLGSHIVEGVEYPNLPSIAKAYGLKFNQFIKDIQEGVEDTVLFQRES